MNSFDNVKKKIGFAATCLAGLAMCTVVPLVGCGSPTTVERRTETVWVDMLEPVEPDVVPVTSPAVRLPNKPAAAPETDKTRPTEFGAPSVSDDCYTLDTSAGVFGVSYDSEEALPAYAYAYVPVTNYDGNAYLKIKANCNSVERIAVLAVYYEQYEQNRPAVTVYNNSVMDGDNIIICELDGGVVLDSAYNATVGEKLTQKSICGFMIMIDSNPKQVVDKYSGTFTVTEMKVTDENDPDLSIRYAAPNISGWKEGVGFNSCTITPARSETTDGMDADIQYSVSQANYAYAEATISNYKPEYTTVKMQVKGENVRTLTIAIKYTLKTSAENIDYNYISSYQMPVGADWENLEYDFSATEELKSLLTLETVPGSYVKNLTPTALYFFIDGGENNAGTLSVRNVEFSKPVEGGAPRVTTTWAVGAGGITKSGVAEGGIGTLEYNKRQGWNPVTVNVASYDPDYSVLVVRVKFYDENSNLGIALGYGTDRTVIQQSAGMSPEPGFGVVLKSHTKQNGSDDGGDYVFHTFEIDFTDATTKKSGSEWLAEQPITKILLYIDAVNKTNSGSWTEPSAGTPLDPARKMQFVGIEFQKPEE